MAPRATRSTTTSLRAVETAHALADASGAAIRPYFRKRYAIDNKHGDGGFDPVTDADRKAERVMRRLIAERHPDHGIVGEEYAETPASSAFRWVLDPIDGTRAFMSGFPLWGTLIGLLDGDIPMIGMMDQPVIGERYWSDGKKSFMRTADGKPRALKARPTTKLDEAILVTTSPDLFSAPADRAAFERVKASVRMTRFGGDCYGYAMVAAGQIDCVVEAGLKAVDIGALIPIIENAGGVVTTWDGSTAIHGGNIAASANPTLHTKLLKRLRG
ncbi:MAG TPA: histidinol-phosphatase [Hyphomicrobiaceae bacterium]|nr:histidinol-phosphatase [Hyphomicrobiaceae bacterium]